MKKICLIVGLMAVSVPSVSFANLVLDIPPLAAKKDYCKEYSGCPKGPCYPGCNDPCVQCNLTCQNYSACPTTCYPECAATDPCQPCTPNPTAKLNDTGITFGGNYPTGNNATCTGETISAQDCSIGQGGFNFTTQGSCVKDNITGLTWSPDQGTATWDTRTSKATTANSNQLCGITTWRVPTVRELLSIVSYNQTNPTVNTIYFSDTGSAAYWSNTASFSNSSNAWYVSFMYGNTAQSTKSVPLSVRLVSGTASSANLIDKGDGTVADKTTGLMWKKCLEGFTNASCTAGSATTFNWQNALKQPGIVNVAGFPASPNYQNWRLPNIKELQSIVDEGKSSPAISTIFPNVPSSSQAWSSSPYVVVGAYSKSWVVDFTSGAVTTPLSRESVVNVRLVRDCTGIECN